ncbi:MAG: glycosyltransferase family 2 protein, partial [Actinomycetota bacterium]
VGVRRCVGAARAAAALFAPRRAAGDDGPMSGISVVVPARNEARRIGPLLEAIVGAPGVTEVVVVDDESTDHTATIAAAAGARVVAGAPKPDGWAGKAWALQQGIESARSEWIVTLDADTRPAAALPSALVQRMLDDDLEFLTVGGRFECPTRPTRWLHASMLTTLVYRFGPPGVATTPDRTMANGQCMSFRRDPFLEAGGMHAVRAEVVEDLALARRLAVDGRRVGFLDASDLLTVRMFESLGDTWTGWGRSLALPGVEPQRRQVLDLGVIVAAQVVPLPRLLVGRGDLVDLVLTLIRLGTLAGTRSAYDRADPAYWLSPLADGVSAVAIARGITRRGRQTWRGRTYT